MKQNHFETLFYSTAGVAAMFVVALSIYVVTSAAKVRVDVTADKAHTLSSGTRRILDKLDSRLTVRFYCTQSDNAMPPMLRLYARHIEDMLAEYDQAAKGKLKIVKIDPEPDSDMEDSAKSNGVEGRAAGRFGSDKFYLGIVVSLLDEKFVLPFLDPQREKFLEYDLSRAIWHVGNRTRPVIGIMSALPVFGAQKDALSMLNGERGAEPWAFVTELRKDFIVKEVAMDAAKIDEDIKVLLVAHPRDISESTQYAIDQYLMKGGKLVAFLDPHAFYDKSHEQHSHSFTIAGDTYGQSSMDRLVRAWGLSMDVDKVAVDPTFAFRNPQNGSVMPAVLLVTREGINESDVVTGQIDNLLFLFAGAFTGTPAPGLKETVLVKCSKNSQMVDSLIASTAGDQILRDFKPANIEYPLAVHLSGTFATAFPNGNPAGKDAKQSRQSDGKGEVVLVADSDLLNDRVCVKVQNVMGKKVAQPMNGNLNFVQSLVEQFSGDDDLITSRSRASMNRPFTRLKEMEARASRQWEDKIHILETKQREMEQKIAALQTRKEGGQQDMILSPDQQRELEGFQQTRMDIVRQLKQVRKNLRHETESLEFWTKVVNISATPALVAVSGLIVAIARPKRRPSK